MRRAFLHRRPREIPLHVRIVAAMLAVCLLLVGLDGYRTWQMRGDVITADKVETANLARSLAQHAHDTLFVVDVILSGLRERIETNGLQPDQTEGLDPVIARHLAEMPLLCGLAVLNAAGKRVAGGHDAADSASFAHHLTHMDRGIHVGEVTRSCDGGQWSLTVSRRIDDAQGRFAGIVQARISVEALQRFYDRFDVGPRGLISLGTLSGTIVARTSGTRTRIGANVSSGPIFRRITPGQATGSFRYVSPFDGVVRLGSFRRIDDYPLYVLVSHGYDEILAGWRLNAWVHMTISVLASMLLVLTGSRIAAQVRIRQQTERRYRLLAENSSDAIVCMGPDHSRLYISPAFTVLTGWSVEEIVGRSAVDIIHPDDRANVSHVFSQLLDDVAQATTCFRYICKDGSLLWVETRARLLRCDDGEMQIISNVRDITDRRAAEDRVAILNRELAERASTDGLTGVANRRRFDEALAEEWQRARDGEVSLSLLMIDVDRFKLFNDRHGHLRGDECLRAVAAAAVQAASGSALTARYGGEEFVMLLPCLDAADAAVMAGRVLAAVRALAIEHADNNPAGVVTVSIGAATVMPRTLLDAGGATTLVAGADAALYEAKRGGRDRMVMRNDIPRVGLPWVDPVDRAHRAIAAAEKIPAFTVH